MSQMAKPIYKVWFVKPNESWYELTTEEQNKLMAHNTESLKQVGAEIILFCNSAWSSEEWLFWGVEKYPDIEAAQMHADNLASVNWFKYGESKVYLGTEMPQE